MGIKKDSFGGGVVTSLGMININGNNLIKLNKRCFCSYFTALK